MAQAFDDPGQTDLGEDFLGHLWPPFTQLKGLKPVVMERAEAQVPGILGTIGAKMGEFGINISQVTVAPTEPGEPGVMGLAVSEAITDEQLAQIIAAAGLLDAKRVRL